MQTSVIMFEAWGELGRLTQIRPLALKLHHTHCSTSPIVKICIYFAIYMTCCTFLPLFADINLYLLRSMSSSHALNDRKVLDVLELQESQISVSPSPQPKVILSSHSLSSWPGSSSCSLCNNSAPFQVHTSLDGRKLKHFVISTEKPEDAAMRVWGVILVSWTSLSQYLEPWVSTPHPIPSMGINISRRFTILPQHSLLRYNFG